MLKFDFSKLMSAEVGEENGLTPEDIERIAERVPEAHRKIEGWRESRDAIFLDIVRDAELVAKVAAAARGASARFGDLVVLGIGGSALGLKCIAQALLPPLWNLRDKAVRGARPRLFVCDNIDPDAFHAILELVDMRDACLVVISKSGRTVETAAQFSLALERLKKAVGARWREHLVVITDPDAGDMRAFVREEGVASFPIPPKLGGRFSALSAVGLFPAASVGVDIHALLEGARAMAEMCASPSIESNPAYRIGGYHHRFDTAKGKPIAVMMPYSDALAPFAEWHAQLWAESLGKDGKGQTPVRALGATDQHSQLQLYMEGPKDKVFTFIGQGAFRTPPKAVRLREAGGAFGWLKGRDLGEIIRAEQRATAEALARAGRPCLTITVPILDEHHLGGLMMLYEIATAFAGALYGINPFDQPGVELGKRLAREMLEA